MTWRDRPLVAAAGLEDLPGRVVDDDAARRPEAGALPGSHVVMSDDRAVERHGEDEAVIRAAVAGAAAKRDVHIAVGDGERAALLLDPPIEGCRRRDDGAELGHARRQVQALEP